VTIISIALERPISFWSLTVPPSINGTPEEKKIKKKTTRLYNNANNYSSHINHTYSK